MNKKYLLLRKLAYAAFIVAAAVATWIYRAQLVAVWRQQGGTLLIAMTIMACALAVQVFNFVAFLDTRARVNRWILCRVWAIASLANYLGPFQPGIAVRTVYLARSGVTVSSSLVATLRQLGTSLWISFGGIALGLSMLEDPRGHLVAAASAAIFVAIIPLRWVGQRLIDRIRRPSWLHARRELLSHAMSRVQLRAIAGVLVQYMLGTLLLYVVYRRFGVDMGIAQALVLACMVYASSLIAILPGNLGVLDAIYMLGGHGMGLDGPASAALALLLRCAQITSCIVISLLGPPPIGKDVRPDA